MAKYANNKAVSGKGGINTMKIQGAGVKAAGMGSLKGTSVKKIASSLPKNHGGYTTKSKKI